jgi:UDP-glucose:(heptosyl)LPS alpha-1,3-glucosyltransferase
VTLQVFDPDITSISPAGSCLLKMLRAASERWPVRTFAARTELSGAGITNMSIPAPRRPVLLQAILFTLLSLARYAFAKKIPGVIISTQGGFPFCDISYAHCCHKLFLTSYRSYVGGSPLTRSARLLTHAWHMAMERIAFQHAKTIVCPSEGLARELQLAYPAMVQGKIQLLPNPVDVPSFTPPAPRKQNAQFVFAFCALGNFAWKGLGLILQALAMGVNAKLLVIGGGAAEIAEFKRLAKTDVQFTGLQTDIRPYLWDSDAFVFPSVYETFPLVCLQAAAAGLPLIVTRLNGVEELMRGADCGWTVERTAPALFAAMQAAAGDRNATLAKGQAARRQAKHFDAPAFEQRWLAIIDQSMKHGRGTA